MRNDPVLEVLRTYPQIYHACHVRHPRARTHPDRISAREGWILSHLNRERPVSATTLARHMALGASTVSEAVQRLERLGLVTRRRADDDQRRMELLLTTRGTEALKGASVLDAARVKRLLAQLPASERATAVAGMTLLGKAARLLNQKEPRRWDAERS
jgi:DNA-binding MarR family transcriptional regulator